MHTLLGASGAIGQAVAAALEARGLTYRTVSRRSNLGGSNHAKADLLRPEEALRAVEGSDYVYLCVGLPYRSRIWKEQWGTIMQNVIDACAAHAAKLIFLDNVYMYAAPLPLDFDEHSPQNPPSRKGAVRKQVADRLLRAIETGEVEGLIARSADFYGERAVNSYFYLSFLERMLGGENPQVLSSPNVPHTYANVQDNGRAMVELALCRACYGQVWHLPVGPPITTQQLLSIFNEQLGSQYQLSVMPKPLRSLLSLFVPVLREVSEMQYQFDQPYRMSFEKFRGQFPNFKVTPYKEGVADMIAWFREGKQSAALLA